MCVCSLQFRLFGEVVFVLFFIYYLQKEIRKALYFKPMFMYFAVPANLFEVLFLSLILGSIVMWLRFVTDSSRVSVCV
jgi:hypothetical protein